MTQPIDKFEALAGALDLMGKDHNFPEFGTRFVSNLRGALDIPNIAQLLRMRDTSPVYGALYDSTASAFGYSSWSDFMNVVGSMPTVRSVPGHETPGFNSGTIEGVVDVFNSQVYNLLNYDHPFIDETDRGSSNAIFVELAIDEAIRLTGQYKAIIERMGTK